MNIKMVNKGSSAELYLAGRIDASVAPQLQDALLEVAERFDRIVLDFEKVPYISSAGLRALRVLHKAMRQKNGSFALRNVRKDVVDVFNITGFGVLLDYEEMQ